MIQNLYIGLMSGTSIDGIDTALVNFNDSKPRLVNHLYVPYLPSLRQQISALCHRGDNEIERLGELDVLLGQAFAKAVNELLKRESLTPHEIRAIGSHGQTIRHAPNHNSRFTLQIGDPNTIAALTSITTVADFRRKDMALGGQGAPLVPAFHRYMLPPDKMNRAIVNIGGIANVTILKKDDPDDVLGFDTGPGNILMDAWIDEHLKKKYDDDGQWASEGQVNAKLLELLLRDDYFHKPPPKSTGREYFNLTWLKQIYHHAFCKKLNAVDVQATLLELTAQSIFSALSKKIPNGEILICGGGAKNNKLIARLRTLANPTFAVDSTEKYGILPDWVEAMAFAWLAFRTLHKLPGNIPSVTGAKQNTILGAVYFA